jgi:hypothetical protein
VLNRIFQPIDVRGRDRRMAGDRQLATQVKKVVLNVRQQRPDGRRQRVGERDPQGRIQLVDGTDCLDAGAGLRDARAIAEARGSGVPGAGDDARQAMPH